jgi:two-component system sensor histidine kinase KdpD
MSGSFLDAGLQPFAPADFGDAWTEALRRTPTPLRYAASLVLVAAAVGVGYALERLVTPANLTLIFVLPVVIAATAFGWGPSLAAVVAGALAFDFFFTEPRYQLAIASPTDLWAAILLLVIAPLVSTVAAEARRRAIRAQRAARQAGALQGLAHVVIEGRPRREIFQAAAIALGQIFGAPAAIFQEGKAGVELLASSARATITQADEEAALGDIALQLPSRARSYPFEESHFDFWPLRTASAGTFVIGVDFSQAPDGRPPAPERFVETVGAYLAAAAPRLAAV